jgi:hypothetical protein
MASSNIFKNQIQNRNFLTPVGFKFILNRAPKVAFFSNQASIPGLTLGVATQPTYLKDIDVPGDKIVFNDLTLRFLVDENLENYMEIQNWMRGLGYPNNLDEIYKLQKQNTYLDTADSKLMNIYSDATMNVLTSSQNTNFKVKYRDLFPVSLSDLEFDATNEDIQYFTADVTFKYTIYDIVDLNGDPL